MYKKDTHIHFVGIGGIGMSGIAHVLHQRGYKVSGCDSNSTQKSVLSLIKNGCCVSQGNNGPACNDASIDVAVYSTALLNNQAELTQARARGIPVVHRADMLAELMRTSYSIAVTGTHGKTTTSSLVAHILLEADYDPTIIVGGHINTLNSNARAGNSGYLVAEVDESDRSHLKLFPTISIITNIDLDHLETYKDIDDITHSMDLFLKRMPFYGTAILCIDSEPVRSLIPGLSHEYVTYGHAADAQFKISNVQEFPAHITFDLQTPTNTHQTVRLSMPGLCNVSNAVGAWIAAQEIGITDTVIIKALSTFQGVDRRFTHKGSYNGADIFDDYGHHPAEIKHSIAIARTRSKGKVKMLFQPHRYTRTHMLWDEFLTIFKESALDELVITDIYPASEHPIEGITGALFVEALRKLNPPFSVLYIPLDKEYLGLTEHFKKSLKPYDLLILQGAGSINAISETLNVPL